MLEFECPKCHQPYRLSSISAMLYKHECTHCRRVNQLIPEAKEHLERYWQRSLDNWNRSDLPMAVFSAITLIEEVGKVIMLRSFIIKESEKLPLGVVSQPQNKANQLTRLVGAIQAKLRFRIPTKSRRLKKEKHLTPDEALRDHKTKYLIAAIDTLFVNSRVTRIYGDLESRFAKWATTGRLFEIRNKALYLERKGQSFNLPHKLVTKEEAMLLICFAGEIYAEVLDPEDWQRVLGEVDSFRAANNFPPPKLENPA